MTWHRNSFFRRTVGRVRPVLASITLAGMVCAGFGAGWIYENFQGQKWVSPVQAAPGQEQESRGNLSDPEHQVLEIMGHPGKNPMSIPDNQLDKLQAIARVEDQRPVPAVPPIDLFESMDTPETRNNHEIPITGDPEVFSLHFKIPEHLIPQGEVILLSGSGEFSLLVHVVSRTGTGIRSPGHIGNVETSASLGKTRHEILNGNTVRIVFSPLPYSSLVHLDVRIDWRDGSIPDSGPEGDRPILLEQSLKLMTPMSSALMIDGIIDGYEIGPYLDPLDPAVKKMFRVKSNWPEQHPDRYQHPPYFYRVDSDNKDLRISPHVSLGFFAIDYPWESLGLPQYVAIDHHLVRKLEELISLMRREGYHVPGFTPIYGFRPPVFNLGTIKSNPDTNLKAYFSMHQYGRAVDFIIDSTGDGVMDDLNQDGTIDIYDAAVIMHYVNILDRQYRESGFVEMVGGAGMYSHHDFVERLEYFPQTPYIHVDTRGFLRPDRTLIRWVGNGTGQWPNGETIRWGDI